MKTLKRPSTSATIRRLPGNIADLYHVTFNKKCSGSQLSNFACDAYNTYSNVICLQLCIYLPEFQLHQLHLAANFHRDLRSAGKPHYRPCRPLFITNAPVTHLKSPTARTSYAASSATSIGTNTGTAMPGITMALPLRPVLFYCSMP